MQILYWLEGLRMPGLNEFMLLITTLGEETAFLALALVFFWCVDKKKGYFLMSVGFIGTMVNQFLKLWFRIPRPWVLDPEFTILEQAREAASGYSFPSGHTQMAVGTFGAIGASDEKRWVKVLCVSLAVLVGISRMYLGVHTPQDVLVSACIAVVLVFALKKVTLTDHRIGMKVLLAVMLAMAVGLLLYVEKFPFPADIDPHNLQSGVKNAYTMIGCLTGVAIVYVAEKKYVCFTESAVWWAQILKVVLGLGAVLAVKEGLRGPLDTLFAGHMASRAVRYFLIVIVAGLVWPMTFRWFAKLGRKRRKYH